MPFGEFQYSVDDKGRVIIPPSFREFVNDGMVVTRGLDSCLYIFPIVSWNRLEKSLSELPLTDATSRNFVRFFYSSASKAKIDSAGRIKLTNGLRAYAGISDDDKTVVIAGAPNRLELWNESRWIENIKQIQKENPTPELLQELVG